MITIAAKRLNTFLIETRGVLGIRKRIGFQPITFTASNDCLMLRSRTDDVAIGYQIGGQFGETAFTVSLHDLSLVRHARGDMRFSPTDNYVNVSWQEPQTTISRTLPTFGSPIYYECPTVLYSNDTSLAQALLCAAQTTDSKSLRYSIGCVRLRSSDGQIAATDGRQAYVHSGFSLPAGEQLVPATALKSFGLLSKAESISVGLRDDWVCFRIRVGDCRWSIDIKRQLTGRFPDLDRCIPHPQSARSTLVICHEDADLLTERLRRLPCDPAVQGPITLDLAKRPVVRFKVRNTFAAKAGASAEATPDAGQDRAEGCGVRNRSQITEIALTHSEYTGLPIRCAANHSHLLNALRFGFREFHFQAAEFPAFCRMENRAYVCALCHSSQVVLPGPCDERLQMLVRAEAVA